MDHLSSFSFLHNSAQSHANTFDKPSPHHVLANICRIHPSTALYINTNYCETKFAAGDNVYIFICYDDDDNAIVLRSIYHAVAMLLKKFTGIFHLPII